MVVDTFSRKPNGLDRPLYFDRQLLQAEDLSLEQGFGDFRLALLARNCIGWGVAAGLILRIEAGGASAGALSVSPGYALTPMGREVYLPAEVRFDAIEALIRELCRDMPDCTNVDAPGTAENRGSSVTAWVIARIAEQDGGLRTAFPEGCGHPGNNTRPSRRCGGARIEIVCAIAPPHCDPPLDDECQHRTVCGPWGPELPEDLEPALDYVVLGRVEASDEGLYATPEDRRRIVRLDDLGRVACDCCGTELRFVTHIERDQRDADRSIDRLAGVDKSGTFWIETLAEAIARIERGGTTYVTLPARGGLGAVVRVRRRGGRKYLQTEADAKPPNNLLSLPEIGTR
jgi:hypothetical protein